MILSWVVPLYNCAGYIGRCIESLQKQRIAEYDYEIIIVDDESSDNGTTIVEAYRQRHRNISLLRQPHQGPGVARNNGMKVCRGKYVAFADADDVIRPNAVGEILRALTVNHTLEFDAIGFNHRNFTDIAEISPINEHVKISFHAYRMYDFCCVHGFRANSVDYIFKREFLRKYGISFPNYKVGEDLTFMLDVYALHDALIAYTPTIVYLYFQRTGSLSNSTNASQALKDFDTLCDIQHKILHSKSLAIYPQDVRDKCSLDFVQSQAIIKLLAASLKMPDLKELFAKAYTSGLFPFRATCGTIMSLLSILSQNPRFTNLASYLYRYVYVPLIRNRRTHR